MTALRSIVKVRVEDAVAALLRAASIPGVTVYTSLAECDGPMDDNRVEVIAGDSAPTFPDAPLDSQARANQTFQVTVMTQTTVLPTEQGGTAIGDAREKHLLAAGAVFDSLLIANLATELNGQNIEGLYVLRARWAGTSGASIVTTHPQTTVTLEVDACAV